MKRFIVFLVSAFTVMLVSAWSPTVDIDMQIPVVTTGVEFNDTGFDYFARDYGYIHLLREGNVVTVRLNDIPEGGLKLSYTKAFDEFFGKYEKPTDTAKQFSRDTLQAKVGIDVGKNAVGLGMTFRNTELEEAMTHFLNEFVALGFKPVEAVRTANTLAFDCGCTVNADVHMRVVFTRVGEDVTVHISAV
jgi:hypothetical protein